ncbi:hypothetical protein [Lysinibacillus xylanilyticus]|uniref:hypothetical protein n=1 Tax=Lysinibacillus xylanilyticus TaxID=582475 RepID=UPI00083CA461|nr:hypothetical protein [Lysinibacillus xylanilyticus]
MKKEDLKKELFSYFKNFTVLLLVSIPLSLGISVTKSITKIEDKRVIWFIDLGIYNLIALIIVSFVVYWFISKRTKLTISIHYTKERLRELKINSKKNKRIIFEVNIEGNYKDLPEKIIIVFPNWIDTQPKRSKDLIFNDSENKYEIDLLKMINDTGKITEKRNFEIDLIGNEDVNNFVLIKPTIISKKRRIMTFIIKDGIKIELEGK